MFFFRFKLLLIVVFLYYNTCSLGNSKLLGGESSGVGGCFVLLNEPISFLFSPLASGNTKKLRLATAYENKFLVDGLSTSGIVAVFPLSQNFNSAFGYSRFGSSIYSVDQIAVGGTKTFSEKIEVALRFDLFIERYGNGEDSHSKYSVAVASKYRFSRSLLAAVLINEPVSYIQNKPPVHPHKDRSIHIGLIKSSKKLQLGITVDMLGAFQPYINVAIKYFSGAKFMLLSGISTGPNVFNFGFGYDLGRWSFSTSSSYNTQLGFSPSTSLNFNFDKSKN